MRPLDATLTGAAIASVVALALVAWRGELRWLDLIGTAAAFLGFRWFLLDGDVSPGYTDRAIEQNRARRAERRRAHRDRDR